MGGGGGQVGVRYNFSEGAIAFFFYNEYCCNGPKITTHYLETSSKVKDDLS